MKHDLKQQVAELAAAARQRQHRELEELAEKQEREKSREARMRAIRAAWVPLSERIQNLVEKTNAELAGTDIEIVERQLSLGLDVAGAKFAFSGLSRGVDPSVVIEIAVDDSGLVRFSVGEPDELKVVLDGQIETIDEDVLNACFGTWLAEARQD